MGSQKKMTSRVFSSLFPLSQFFGEIGRSWEMLVVQTDVHPFAVLGNPSDLQDLEKLAANETENIDMDGEPQYFSVQYLGLNGRDESFSRSSDLVVSVHRIVIGKRNGNHVEPF